MNDLIVSPRILGKFRIEKIDYSTNKITEIREFNNLVLNAGLVHLAHHQIAGTFQKMAVGTGTITANVAQTTLAEEIASVNISNSPETNETDASGRIYRKKTYNCSFSASAVEGNITEVGIGWSGNPLNLAVRQLIKDDSGNPTAITVLPQEGLNVHYVLHIYGMREFLTKQPIGNCVCTNVTTGITETHNVFLQCAVRDYAYYSHGFGKPNKGYSNIIANYNDSEYSATYTLTENHGYDRTYDQSNYMCPYYPAQFNNFQYRFYFDPPLIKDRYHTMTFKFKVKWGRYESQP